MRRWKFLAAFGLLGLALAAQASLQAVPRSGAGALLRSGLVAALLLAAALGLGRALALRLRLLCSSLFEEAAFSFGLGLAALSVVSFGLGAAGVLYPWLAWMLLAVALLLGFSHLEHFAGYLRRNLKVKRPWEGSPTEVALLLASGWTAVAMLGLALAPVSFYDALVYHLATPQRAALSGAFRPQEAVFYTWLPGAAEQLWALALVLDPGAPQFGPNAAVLLNLGAAAVLVLAVTDLSARLASTQRQWTGPALLLAQPLAALAFAVFGADGWGALYALLSLFAFLNTGLDKLEPSRAPWRTVAFFFAGMAVAMKPVAGLHALALVLLSLGLALRHPSWRRPVGWAACAAALLLPLLPWLLRGFLLRHQPFYPFGLELAGQRLLAGAPEGYFNVMASYGSGGLQDLPWWRLPLALSFESSKLGGGGHLLALFLALAPAAYFLRHGREQAVLGAYCALSLPLWALGPHVERYFLPFVPALAVYAGFQLSALEGLAQSRGLALALRALVCGAAFLGASQTLVIVAKDFDPWRAALGLEAPEAYLPRMGVQTDRAGAWLKARLGPSARGLVLGDSRSAGLPAGAVVATVFEAHPAAAWLGELDTPQDVAGKLKQKGYDFVLINRAEGSRTATLAGLAPRGLPQPAARAFELWLEGQRASGGDRVFDADQVLAVALR